jgi:hypothetical protein
MDAKNNPELKAIQRNMVRSQIISAPAMILIGLALYGLFGADGQAFHPLLDDLKILYVMLLVGVVIELWLLSVFLPLARKHAMIARGITPQRPPNIDP